MKKQKYSGQGDPWADFLHYRKELIMVWMAEGAGCREIANILSMDETQVYMIYQAHLPRLS